MSTFFHSDDTRDRDDQQSKAAQYHDPVAVTVVSSRSHCFLKPPLGYVLNQIKAIHNEYHPTTNPSGWIPLAVAENKLCADMLLEQIALLQYNDYPKDVMNYTASSGLPRVRKIFADFLQRFIFDGHRPEDDQLIISPGCCALLHQLSILLFEPGDGILAPNPYYPAFDHDFLDLGQVAVIEVNNHAYADISIINSTDTNDKAFTLSCCITREALEEAYIRSESSGHPPRGLLLTNPSNPLGIIYSEKEIRMAIDWAASKCPPLHVIADEIYALSVFETTNSDNIDCDHNSVSSSSTNSHQPFVSIVKMLENKLGNHVHFLWSLSKDFGGSGLRCGVMYSQNRSLLQAMGACNDTMMVSNLMQHVAGCLLQDTPFIEAYLRENRTRLFRSYTFLRSNLLALDIPVIDASGGLFLFANFRKYLSVDSFEGEISLQEELATSCGIVLTPGKSCHCQVPGYFRICYAWVPLSSLEEAIRRLQKMYKSRL